MLCHATHGMSSMVFLFFLPTYCSSYLSIYLTVRNSDPVVTQCGHLYCWPCLFRWLNTNHTTCPVCKAGVTQENVIPIFIRGDGPMEDPRMKTAAAAGGGGGGVSSATSEEGAIPSRPVGHRPEPVTMPASPAINIGYNFAGVSFSAGFGFFPSLFGLQFQSFAPAPSSSSSGSAPAESDDELQQAYLSRVLLFLGLSVIFCLLFF